jgi:hypothetical protein
MARGWRKARWMAAPGLLLLALGLQRLATFYPDLVERYYSRGLFPYIGRRLALINGYFTFSLFEAGVILLLLGLPGAIIWQMRKLYLGGASFVGLLLSTLLNLIWLFGGGALLFLLLWGLNYQRPPLAAKLGLQPRQATASELEMIGRAIVIGINRNYEAASANQDWVEQSHLPMSWSQLYQVIEAAYQQEALLSSFSVGGFSSPKPAYFSRAMSWLGMRGLYSPFTGEPNFNAEQPDCSLPFSIAHEMAHQRGFAREDEASFIAFLVCVKATHPYVRYSGYLEALNVVLALYTVAPERYREVMGALGAGPRADLQARAQFWQRYRGRLQRFTHRVNDNYLKANSVRSGVGNYSEVASLIIAYYLTHPVPEGLHLSSD